VPIQSDTLPVFKCLRFRPLLLAEYSAVARTFFSFSGAVENRCGSGLFQINYVLIVKIFLSDWTKTY